ncbi:MAG: AmmeMemoRadiSam system protein B, partial [Acidobacteriota bacterium]
MLTFTFVMPQPVRRAAVAGTWYSDLPDILARDIDRYCARVDRRVSGDVAAVIAPHAGLMYSGPVAAYAYQQLVGRSYEVAVVVGPSHYVGFEGVAVFPEGAFETPFGTLMVSEGDAAAILAATPVVRDCRAAHRREHSLEMQLPFLQRVIPGTPIVPLIMGHQTRETVLGLAAGLATALQSRRALLVASSDLSHYHDARQAAKLDRVVVDAIEQF